MSAVPESEEKKVEEALKNFSVEDENIEKGDEGSSNDEKDENDDDDGSSENVKENPRDDLIDEEQLKSEEECLSEEQLTERHEKAKKLKESGNIEYTNGECKESILSYTKGLLICPLREKELRAVLYSNRAASKIKLELKEAAIEDCTSALKHNPNYLKALNRRARLYDETEKFDEALVDYKKIIELDPTNRDAHQAVQRIPSQINERNEKLKAEMLGKLKELGNMVLRPFGLSTDNFQLQQDPGSGSYSVNFQK